MSAAFNWRPNRQLRDPANLSRLGPGRCFPFWQEVLACYVVNTSTDDDSGKKKCVPVLEDYYECLHHKKEASVNPYKMAGRGRFSANTQQLYRLPGS